MRTSRPGYFLLAQAHTAAAAQQWRAAALAGPDAGDGGSGSSACGGSEDVRGHADALPLSVVCGSSVLAPPRDCAKDGALRPPRCALSSETLVAPRCKGVRLLCDEKSADTLQVHELLHALCALIRLLSDLEAPAGGVGRRRDGTGGGGSGSTHHRWQPTPSDLSRFMSKRSCPAACMQRHLCLRWVNCCLVASAEGAALVHRHDCTQRLRCATLHLATAALRALRTAHGGGASDDAAAIGHTDDSARPLPPLPPLPPLRLPALVCRLLSRVEGGALCRGSQLSLDATLGWVLRGWEASLQRGQTLTELRAYLACLERAQLLLESAGRSPLLLEECLEATA